MDIDEKLKIKEAVFSYAENKLVLKLVKTTPELERLYNTIIKLHLNNKLREVLDEVGHQDTPVLANSDLLIGARNKKLEVISAIEAAHTAVKKRKEDYEKQSILLSNVRVIL